MLAAKEKKHLDYSSVCRVVVSSNFRKSMTKPREGPSKAGKWARFLKYHGELGMTR